MLVFIYKRKLVAVKLHVGNVGNVCGMSGPTSCLQQNYFFCGNAVRRMIGILDIVRTWYWISFSWIMSWIFHCTCFLLLCPLIWFILGGV
jgi:hypothetical protein